MEKQYYNIEYLIEAFQRHHDEMKEYEKKLDEKYPDRKKILENEFSIGLALKSICEHHVMLRGVISSVKDSIDAHMVMSD